MTVGDATPEPPASPRSPRGLRPPTAGDPGVPGPEVGRLLRKVGRVHAPRLAALHIGPHLKQSEPQPQQQQQHRRPASPPPAVPAAAERSPSPSCAYTVKRFLVINYDADDSGAMPPLPQSTPATSPVEESVMRADVQGLGPSPGSARGQDEGHGHGHGHGGERSQQHAPPRAPVADGVDNDGFVSDDVFTSAAATTPRRDSMHPSAAKASGTGSVFPEDERTGRCCCSILCGKCCRGARRVLAHPLCPSTAWLTRFVAMIIIGALFLGTAILVIGGNGWFQIVCGIVVAQIVGILIYRATSLPPLIGMLLVGVFCRQLGYIEYFSASHEALIYIARSFALVVLMVRTGFQLDTAGGSKLSPLMVGLAIIPGLVEFAVVAALAGVVLGAPPLFALLSGVILAAACPSILRPCFSLMGAGRAVQAQLVAVACLNDMIVILVFGIVMAFIYAFAGDSLPYVLLHRVMGVGAGIILGVVAGLLLRVLPDPHDPMVNAIRSILLGSVGMFSMIGFARIGFFGGGPVACLVAAWLSSWGWRRQGWGPDYRGNPVATVFDVLWRIMQPVMFCLIGADLDVSKTSYDMNKLLLSVLVLLLAWLVRVVVSMVVMSYGSLSIKERLYVTLAWVPKAGVQAALCPLALDLARYRDIEGPILTHARDSMLLVLLAVVITAPLSAALTSRRGLANVLVSDLRRTSTASRTSGPPPPQQSRGDANGPVQPA